MFLSETGRFLGAPASIVFYALKHKDIVKSLQADEIFKE